MNRVLRDVVIDLVLFDLRLDEEDGMQLARGLRERMDVALIIVTGMHDEADCVKGLEIAAADYVTKPFSSRDLLARVRGLAALPSQAVCDGTPARRQALRLPFLGLGVQRLGAPSDESAR